MLCTTSDCWCCLFAVTTRENAVPVKGTEKPRGLEVNLESGVWRPREVSSMKNGAIDRDAHREVK